MNTYEQTSALLADIDKASGPVSWEVGKMVNALVKAAQEDYPENVILVALAPLLQVTNTGTTKAVTFADVRAILGQVKLATKEPDALERIQQGREERLREERS